MDFLSLIFSPSLPFFFTMFLTIYLVAHLIIFRNWSPKIRPEAASCLISLAHGSPAVFLASHPIISDPNHTFASPNTELQNSVLEYSISYFITDLIHYITFYPTDIVFISHHLATLFVLVLHGAYAVLGLLVIAEVTSLFQNVWTLGSAKKGESEVARKVFDVMSVPLFVYRMVVFYSSGVADSVVPRWLWVSWIFVVVGAIPASILWVSNNWIQFYRERMFRIQKEKKIR